MEALKGEKDEIEDSDVQHLAMLSLNWGAFAKSIESLQRILLYVSVE